jgi:formylglycine-generating enzyme required for sulfatase activity
LPSEAEWEYACRAGTTTPFHFGKTITSDLANYDADYTYAFAPTGEYQWQTTEVGRFPANAFGLYDMHGNVWEWCADYWHNTYDGAPIDGSAWITGGDETLRPLRGGSWDSIPRQCRSAFRYWLSVEHKTQFTGFRVVCSSV